MSYTDPKIYFSDPTAFQKGFQGSFNEYIKLQREQIEKQKKSDEAKEKEEQRLLSGFYGSDVYTQAPKELRDVLTMYFKDVKEKYSSISNRAEKEKIMGDALAEANEYVNSYRLTNESRGNLISIDYAGKPIEDFMYSEEPGMPSYRNGKLGMEFGKEKTFLSKQDMIQSKPIYASEVEESVSNKVKESLDFFNKNNVPDNIDVVRESRNSTINDLISNFTQREKIAYYTRNNIVLQENETLEQAIAKDLEETFNNTKVYNEATAKYSQFTKQELEIQKEQRAEQRAIRAEQRKAQAKTEKPEKRDPSVEFALQNEITTDQWNSVLYANDERATKNLEKIVSPYGLTITKEIVSGDTGESVTAFRVKKSTGTAGQGVLIFKSDELYDINSKIKKYIGVDPFDQYLINK